MANDYSDINLSPNLQSLTGPVSQTNPTGDQLKEYIDNKVNEILRPGGINYTNIISSGRSYTAIVDTSNAGGAFTDIQDAINYVNSLGGGSIYIKKGTYVLSSSITLYSNIFLIGEDPINTILDFNSTTNQIVINVLNNVSITNLTIKNCANTTNGTVYIANNSYQITLRYLYFVNNRNTTSNLGYDIYIDGACPQLVIDSCNSTGAGTFLWCWGVGDGVGAVGGPGIITNNYIASNNQDAIVGGANGTRTINCYFNNNTLTAISKSFVNGFFDYCSFANNSFTGINDTPTPDGMIFTNISLGNIISGNQIFSHSGTTANIINFQGTTVGPTISGQNIVNGNRLFGANFITGIVLNSTVQTVIDGNWISTGTAAYGVNIADGTCSNNAIVGNYLKAGTATNNAGTLTVIANNS